MSPLEDPTGSQSGLQTESRRVAEKSEITTNKQTNIEEDWDGVQWEAHLENRSEQQTEFRRAEQSKPHV